MMNTSNRIELEEAEGGEELRPSGLKSRPGLTPKQLIDYYGQRNYSIVMRGGTLVADNGEEQHILS